MRIALLVPNTDPAQTYSRDLAAALIAASHDVFAPALDDPCDVLAMLPQDAFPVVGITALPGYAAREQDTARKAAALVADAALPETVRPLLSQVACVIATREPVAKHVAAACSVPTARIHAVEPGTPDFCRSDGPLAAGPCQVLALAATRAGIETVLHALGRLPDLDWTATILLATAGLDTPCLATRAATLSIAERTRFTASDAEPPWQSAGVCVLADDETVCGRLAEALRRGLPVAVAADAARADRVPAAVGVMAAAGDHASLSKALRRIIFDRDVRLSMANAAWTHGRTLPDWNTQARLFVSLLEQA
jgi:hypothetical protein